MFTGARRYITPQSSDLFFNYSMSNTEHLWSCLLINILFVEKGNWGVCFHNIFGECDRMLSTC
jgi:hypothetical protein